MMTNTENDICISGERYAQLLRAEHDANRLKDYIANAYEGFETFDRGTLQVLYALFIGKKEEA